MMISQLTLGLVVALILPAWSLAAVFMEIVDENQEHPGQCFVKGAAYSVGDSWDDSSASTQPTSTCQRKSCSTYNENQFLVITSTCPSVAAESPCYMVEDKTASYPDCCPRFECPPPAAAEDTSSIRGEEELHASAASGSNAIDGGSIRMADNEIDQGHDNIMMESRIPEPVRVMMPPAPAGEEIVSYDVTLGDDDVTDGDDVFSSPFRSFVPARRYGKPIVQLRRQ